MKIISKSLVSATIPFGDSCSFSPPALVAALHCRLPALISQLFPLASQQLMMPGQIHLASTKGKINLTLRRFSLRFSTAEMVLQLFEGGDFQHYISLDAASLDELEKGVKYVCFCVIYVTNFKFPDINFVQSNR